MSKIEKLKEISGNKEFGFTENELLEDFDPAKHDQMMQVRSFRIIFSAAYEQIQNHPTLPA